jgi:hypothetical protein
MKTKKFDQSLHDQYDDIGRNVVKDYFKNRLEIDAIDNPNIYGVDLLLCRNDVVIGYAEVEVRNSWKTDVFPFDTLNVPFRKKKLLENDLSTFFFSINYPMTRMFCCTAETILECNIQENKNKYVNSNEYFYKVPIDKLKSIELMNR